MSYKELEIWKIADELVTEIHKMTLNDLPKFEMFETGSQIRRSIKSVKSNIVEGYGRQLSVNEHPVSSIQHLLNSKHIQFTNFGRSEHFSYLCRFWLRSSMDRMADSGSVGCGFESLRSHT
jgi:23S rRNA-intervening sequence protein